MNSGFPVSHRTTSAVFRLTIVLLVLLGLSACSRYQLTFNEAVVHTPPPLLTDFDTEDPRLRSCLDQMIKDGKVTAFEQLTQLICSHAGLTSLKGIEAFPNLQRVNLEHNQLVSLKPLQHLSQLEVLKLNDNFLTHVPELLTLQKLKTVQLENNPKLSCQDLQQLQQHNTDITVQLPQQCR